MHALAGAFLIYLAVRTFFAKAAAGAAQPETAGYFSALLLTPLTGGVFALRHAIGARARRAVDILSSALLGVFGVVDLKQAVE